MDRLSEYRKLLKQIMLDFTAWVNEGSDKDSELVCLFDEDRDHYMVARVQWGQFRIVQGAQIFVRIRDGKIWIEEDWTANGIATNLLQADVPQEDIILGFQPPELRTLTNFAVV